MLALATLVACASFGVVTSPAADAYTVYARYRVTTDVSARNTPTAAPGGYGIPNGGAFDVLCQELGQPVGPRGNTLYFLALYQGRVFYVPDTWTNSPHLAGQPPIAGIAMCPNLYPSVLRAPDGGTVNIRETPPGRVFYVAPTGTRARMRCWTTGPVAYNTGKWFVIQVAGRDWYGYVNAALVSNQTTVGRC